MICLVIGFVKLVIDTAAIRRVLENQGLFSGVVCPECRMAVPQGSSVCGHCGRDIEARVGRP